MRTVSLPFSQLQGKYPQLMFIQENEKNMMFESKGQHIGKAPSLHFFHTIVRQHPSGLNLLPSMQLLMLCITL